MNGRSCGVMLAAGMALACAGGDVTGAGDGLDVSVELSASQLVVGDELEVTVRAENVSSRTVTPDLGPCILTFEVLSGGGTVVAPEQTVCPLILVTADLEPGAAYEFTFTWRGDRDGSASSFLPPGTYHVRGVLDLRSGAAASPAVPLQVLSR